jgi:hypothetical protein
MINLSRKLPLEPRAGKRARRSVADRDHLFIRSARTGCLAPSSGRTAAGLLTVGLAAV